jgi:hypothetical protein
MMLATRNVTVVEAASDCHTVVVYRLANVEASVEIVPSLRRTTTELQDYNWSAWHLADIDTISLTKQVPSQPSAT